NGDIAGAATTVNTASVTAGSFVYGLLPSPVTLAPNYTYYILSAESNGGDQWYDYLTTTATTTADATLSGAVYGAGAPYSLAYNSAGELFGPVDFQYVALTVSPATATLTINQTQQFSAVGVGIGNTATWSISPSTTGSISTTGVYSAPAAIATQQTVTVTASSTLNPSLTGTATVTLNPPAGIAQQPQNTSVFIGETATFSLTANGVGVTYQWQSMVSGATAFTNISGANASSYTTPPAVLVNSGTQYRCIVAISGQNFTSNAATLTVLSPGSTFITSKALGTPRNNYTGWQGMSITVGAKPLVVTGLGRLAAPGNSASHTLKLVDAVAGVDIQGGSTSVNMSGASSGSFVYGALPSPITLNANATYYLVSQETQGGDQWYDVDTVAGTTSDATLAAAVRGGPPYAPVSNTAGHPYGPVDFEYVALTVSPATVTLFGGQTQQFSASAVGIANGVTWSIPPNMGSVSPAGLYTAPATVTSSGSVTVTATSTADPSLSASATINLVALTVTVTPPAANLIDGQTQQFTATVAGSNNPSVTWSINPAGLGAISQSGLYTAPSPIATTAKVTVTATSVANNAVAGTASVTLGPAPPIITAQPANVTTYAGQTATFTVTASGTGIAYQWQSMAPGANSFTNITGAVSSFYTTPATTLAASGTQYQCILTNTQGTVTSSAATLTVQYPGVNFVTNQVLGSTRNNFSGWVGMSITVGPAPIVVKTLGRMVATGNVGTHSVKIVDAATGNDIGGSAITLNTSGGTPGQFVYNALPNPITLIANTTYYIVSLETSGGDAFYDSGATTAQTTADATLVGAVFGTSPPMYTVVPGSVSHMYGPLDFTYVAIGITPAVTTLSAGQQQQFAISVTGLSSNSVTWNLSPPNVGSITPGGLYTAPTSIAIAQTITLTATSTVDTTKSATAIISLAPISVTAAPAAITLFAAQQQPFTATVTGITNTAVTWSISPSTNAGTITSAGVYTAPASITSSQTVTVTATSVADATKYGTAMVTLSPPVPPTITTQPQNSTAVVGQSATFTVVAAGLGLTYQWQSMAPGAGVFSNIAGATASSYTTPATALTDNGTLFKCVVTNAQGTVNTNVVQLTVAAQGIHFITSEMSGTLQNDETQWVGMNVKIGNAPLIVTNLGRFVAPGNSQVHELQIIDAATGQPIGSPTQVDTSQGTVGTFIYGVLPKPITLNANSTYYILSHETGNGDAYYNTATVVQTTTDATLVGPAYGPDGGPFVGVTSANNPYGPVDFSYTVLVSASVSPTAVSLFNGQTQQFSASVISNGSTAVTWSINPVAGSISSTGLYTAPQSISATQTVTVTATAVADPTKNATAVITLLPPSAPIITQQPLNANVFVGQSAQLTVTAIGPGLTYQWQSMPPGAGSFSAIVGAVSSSYTTPVTALTDNGTQFRCVITNSLGTVTSASATLVVQSLGNGFVVQKTLGTLRSNFTGWLGMQVNVGSNALKVSSLGRIMVSNNSGMHQLKIVNASTGTDVPGSSVTVSMSGGQVGSFVYGILNAPVTLNANGSYYVVSQETSGQDQFYDNSSTTVQTTTDGSVPGSVYFNSTTGAYVAAGTTSHVYGPLDFKYVTTVSVALTPSTANISAGQQQQFTAMVIGNSNTGVTWSINPNVGSISSTGVYTAPASIPTSQPITVTAASVVDSTRSASALVTLVPVSVTMTPVSATLFNGDTQQFNATVTGTTNTAVTWTISPNIGNITAGLYTAPNNISTTQTVTVTATSVADTTKFAFATITLSPPTPP
ncbi:MAG: hypothetical protein JO336_05605, partial [Acidobacteriia bacterium]|nr:hypothetical protein [Terriglobia bacterium]